jgi:dephospho-CoA kinase
VLAVVGLAGTGKSEVVRHLVEERGCASVYFGSVVLDELKRRALPIKPANEQAVREALRRAEGMHVMAARSLPQIRQLRDAGLSVVIDGLYSDAERHLLQSEIGDALTILAVHAPRWLRARRLATRPVRPLTAIEMDERDDAEVRALDKATPIALADVHVVNDDDIAALKAGVARSLSPLGWFARG